MAGVLAGFAGATADAFTLLERLEAKLERFPDQLERACVELAKDWRSDRYLRRLEALLAVADGKRTLLLTGQGDVLEPEDARDRHRLGRQLRAGRGPRPAAGGRPRRRGDRRRAMEIAGDICVYTNGNSSSKPWKPPDR